MYKESLDNIELFTSAATADYMCWLSAAITMQHAGCNVSTVIAFLKLDLTKFNEEVCVKKWIIFEKYDSDYVQ